jgi:hypothetical protein
MKITTERHKDTKDLRNFDREGIENPYFFCAFVAKVLTMPIFFGR